MPQRDLCDQALEASPMLRAGARLAQVVIDQQHPGSLPPQRHRPVHQRVLQPRGLLVAHHLLPRGLPDVHHRQAFTVPSRDLAPRVLPRHHRDHGPPPLPGSGSWAAVAACWRRAASLRRAITASQYTATRRRACGTAAHTSRSSKPAFWGRRPLPRSTRRRTSRPRGHLPQPFHRGDHAEQALPPHQRLLPCLLTTHRRSLRSDSRRCTTSATPPSPKTPPRPAPPPPPGPWPACATSPSAS